MNDYYKRHKKEINETAARRRNEARIEKAREEWFSQTPTSSQQKHTHIPGSKETVNGLPDKRETEGTQKNYLKRIFKYLTGQEPGTLGAIRPPKDE